MQGIRSTVTMKRKMQKNSSSRRNDVVKKEDSNIKVKYISSPVKVKTSASNFRALVQELTGQDSNVAEAFSMEADVQKGTTITSKFDEQYWSLGVHDYEGYVPQQEGSWGDLALEDYSGFQYSRSLLDPLNQHQLQFDLVQI